MKNFIQEFAIAKRFCVALSDELKLFVCKTRPSHCTVHYLNLMTNSSKGKLTQLSGHRRKLNDYI